MPKQWKNPRTRRSALPAASRLLRLAWLLRSGPRRAWRLQREFSALLGQPTAATHAWLTQPNVSLAYLRPTELLQRRWPGHPKRHAQAWQRVAAAAEHRRRYGSDDSVLLPDGGRASCEYGVLRWRDAEGNFSRHDGPAVIDPDGGKTWWLHGQRHRLDGPAVEDADGSRGWWLHGQRHRLDGPAVERRDGSREWWQDGQRHRLDGPAVEDADGSPEWWKGKTWWQHGQRHRLDGPAIERADGGREWWQHGQRHRPDGPAVEDADGSKEWWQHGQRHRLDGPAVEAADGECDFWERGQPLAPALLEQRARQAQQALAPRPTVRKLLSD